LWLFFLKKKGDGMIFMNADNYPAFILGGLIYSITDKPGIDCCVK